MFRLRFRVQLLALIAILIGSLAFSFFRFSDPTQAATLPSQFVENILTNSLEDATDMAIAPDGRIFITEQDGDIRIIKGGVLLPTPFVTVATAFSSAGFSSTEAGLRGITIDPDFATNNYIYVYYTTTEENEQNRVSRFTASADTTDLSTETIIFETGQLDNSTFNHGGALAFGPDGKLYVGVGDLGRTSCCSEGAAQSLDNLFGKVLRLNPDGTIPEDNPFYDTATEDNRAIWALGLADPRDMDFDAGSGRLFINDNNGEGINEINEGIAGANYGNGATEETTATLTDPIYTFDPDGSSFECFGINGGAFYDPTTVAFPADDVGDYFFSDTCTPTIERFDVTTNTAVRFADAASDLSGGRIRDIAVREAGDLYYLTDTSLYRVNYADGEPSRTFTVNTPADTNDANPGDGVCATSTGECSLRAAIVEANDTTAPDTINFNISAVEPIIEIQHYELPTVIYPVTIDGTTQPDGSSLPVIDGSFFGDFNMSSTRENHGLVLRSGNSTIRGLRIRNFAGAGLWLAAGDNNIVECSSFGYELESVPSSNGAGLVVETNNNTIGLPEGECPNEFYGNISAGLAVSGNNNLIQNAHVLANRSSRIDSIELLDRFDVGGVYVIGSSNQFIDSWIADNFGNGLELGGDGHLVQGNLIGTTLDGMSGLSNGNYLYSNIYIDSSGTNILIGGNTEAQRNIISGGDVDSNGADGIAISGDNNRVQGNYIGTDITGSVALPNTDGIRIDRDADGNIIGGTEPGEGNLISGNNSSGITISGSNTIVQGNLIGTTFNGLFALPNSDGISISVSSGSSTSGINNVIGGNTPAARNVISGNNSTGITTSGIDTRIQGNYIGVNINGDTRLSNDGNGIRISGGRDSLIGGTGPGEGNVISGSTGFGGNGIEVNGGRLHRIQGNIIGGNFDASNIIPNESHGIEVGNGDQILIGGTEPGSANIIIGNDLDGINLFGGTNIEVYGNLIGTNLSGAALGNEGHGVSVTEDSVSATIGGIPEAEANVIVFNNFSGVFIIDATSIPVRGNLIYANAAMGIDLLRITDDVGPTLNDTADGDTGGNNLQNFPVLTSATVEGGNITITGTLNSQLLNTYTLDFYSNPVCDAFGYGEALYYVGTLEGVTTDDIGDASFTATFPAPPGASLSVTATDRSNNTSEFSACLAFEGGVEPTSEPTIQISPTPTEAPTEAPTDDGSEPTEAPTEAPTDDGGEPTEAPTDDGSEPTESPTDGETTATVTPIENVQRIYPLDGVTIATANDYQPSVQWRAIEGALWYHIYIATPDYETVVHDVWYPATSAVGGPFDQAGACTDDVCTGDVIWFPDTGDFVLWIGYWSPEVADNYGDTYDMTTFSVNLAAPSSVSNVAPNGTISETSVTLTFDADPHTLWYQVWVGLADYSNLDGDLFDWFRADEICSEGTCSVAVPGTLAAGDYIIWMRQWGPGGFPDWYTASTFTVAPE